MNRLYSAEPSGATGDSPGGHAGGQPLPPAVLSCDWPHQVAFGKCGGGSEPDLTVGCWPTPKEEPLEEMGSRQRPVYAVSGWAQLVGRKTGPQEASVSASVYASCRLEYGFYRVKTHEALANCRQSVWAVCRLATDHSTNCSAK